MAQGRGARRFLAAVRQNRTARFLRRVLFAEEFVIDEKPQPVYESVGGGKDGQDGQDLATVMSRMLRDQERLAELNEQLRAGPEAGNEELDRFVRRLLTRLEGFDRILEAFRSMSPSEEVQQWLRSLEGLYFKIQGELMAQGLMPIETLGRPVDLNCMEVIDYRRTADYPHNTVIQELKRGYRYKGKVVRDAQVVVACNERG